MVSSGLARVVPRVPISSQGRFRPATPLKQGGYMGGIKRLVLELDEEFHQKIKVKATSLKKSMKQVMIELLSEWVRRVK
jgi:hypothetical protein